MEGTRGSRRDRQPSNALRWCPGNRAGLKGNSTILALFTGEGSRGAEIRTRDLLRPRQARYQAALRPVQ